MPFPPLLLCVDVNGSGNGDGISSTDREWGFKKEKVLAPEIEMEWLVLDA